MPQYLSPGVYVEEVPSAIKAIAGVSTSTAGFIGVVLPDKLPQPLSDLSNVSFGKGERSQVFDLPVYTEAGKIKVKVKGVEVADADITLTDDDKRRITRVTLKTAPKADEEVTADVKAIAKLVREGEAQLCTTFSDYKKFFGDFSPDPGHRNLTHAVYGFFNNGGSRCYVMRVKAEADIPKFLVNFEAIDEIAIVAAPGLAGTDDTGKNTRTELIAHCKVKTQDRFAIFDSPELVETSNSLDLTLLDVKKTGNVLPPVSDYSAFYFPWIQVFDPVAKDAIFAPPSGHIAGIYARVDTQRGVHKAPANEPVIGALGLKYRISKAQQDGLNPQGVNCIRDLNGNLTVWGARTMGGDANADLKYINVRRTLLFLRESIDEGMQFVVFEPNTPALWAKIVRNVSAFLTNVWRSGALFGTTPQEAFFVKCDAELNTRDVRELGQVITEIGVSIVRPAEFVIFRISQFAAPS